MDASTLCGASASPPDTVCAALAGEGAASFRRASAPVSRFPLGSATAVSASVATSRPAHCPARSGTAFAALGPPAANVRTSVLPSALASGFALSLAPAPDWSAAFAFASSKRAGGAGTCTRPCWLAVATAVAGCEAPAPGRGERRSVSCAANASGRFLASTTKAGAGPELNSAVERETGWTAGGGLSACDRRLAAGASWAVTTTTTGGVFPGGATAGCGAGTPPGPSDPLSFALAPRASFLGQPGGRSFSFGLALLASPVRILASTVLSVWTGAATGRTAGALEPDPGTWLETCTGRPWPGSVCPGRVCPGRGRAGEVEVGAPAAASTRRVNIEPKSGRADRAAENGARGSPDGRKGSAPAAGGLPDGTRFA